MSICVPLRTGITEISLPYFVMMGNASGMASSRAATFEICHRIGCSRIDSCREQVKDDGTDKHKAVDYITFSAASIVDMPSRSVIEKSLAPMRARTAAISSRIFRADSGCFAISQRNHVNEPAVVSCPAKRRVLRRVRHRIPVLRPTQSGPRPHRRTAWFPGLQNCWDTEECS